MKILVVDDDESILDAVSLFLEEEGYTVETVLDGEQTFKKVHTFKPQLIFLDILMSGADGREIGKRLKSEEATKHIPLIMISAHPSVQESAIEFGAEAFLAKPFESSELLRLVKKYT